METEIKKKALILLAEGNEDVEVAIPAYVFRYGGLETVIAGIDSNGVVECDQLVKITPDMSLEEARKIGPYDIIFLPGGVRGAPNLAANKLVEEILKEQEILNGLIGAICYSPACSIANFGIYKGRKITCYPKHTIRQIIFDRKTHTFVDEAIVEDGNLITAQGPGNAFEVSLAIVRRLSGEEKASKVERMMLLNK